MRSLDARVIAMTRIDAVWLAIKPIDMRSGGDRLRSRGLGVWLYAGPPRLPVCQRPRHSHQAADTCAGSVFGAELAGYL